MLNPLILMKDCLELLFGEFECSVLLKVIYQNEKALVAK